MKYTQKILALLIACSFLQQSYGALVKCATVGKESPGWDLGDPIKKVSNDATCQVYCQQSADCEYFQYSSGSKTCQLKIALSSIKIDNKKVVTGPKYCSGATGDFGLSCKDFGQCKNCNPFICEQCNKKYFWDTAVKRCVACRYMTNCKKCKHGGCKKCKDGYKRTKYNGVHICLKSKFADGTGLVQKINGTSYCTNRMKIRGVNIAGGEFGSNLPGTYNADYVYPVDATTGADPAYFVEKGFNTFRVPFRWERLQQRLNGTFNQAELARLRNQVQILLDTDRKVKVILDVHNYGRYDVGQIDQFSENAIGESAIKGEYFVDLWRRLAYNFKTYNRVIFGIMNEPHTQSAYRWRRNAQKAINVIRDGGAKNLIIVPGVNWTNAGKWMITPNKDQMYKLVDPLNKTMIDAHLYLDEDHSGKDEECVSESVGYERLKGITTWLRDHGMKGVLSEFGASSKLTCIHAVDRMLSYMETNDDVWHGWAWWAAGPWWGDYMFSIEPNDKGEDKPQMAVLSAHCCPVGLKPIPKNISEEGVVAKANSIGASSTPDIF